MYSQSEEHAMLSQVAIGALVCTHTLPDIGGKEETVVETEANLAIRLSCPFWLYSTQR
jgi:hypothetical protein